jgi:hypothetical protein
MHDTAQISGPDLLADYVRGGDDRAFAAVVALHERMVIGTAWRRTGDAELARDIAQEVFATFARSQSGMAHGSQYDRRLALYHHLSPSFQGSTIRSGAPFQGTTILHERRRRIKRPALAAVGGCAS